MLDWLIVNWTLRNKLQWNSHQNTKLLIHENTFENVVCEMATFLSRGRWVEVCFFCCPSPGSTLSESLAWLIPLIVCLTLPCMVALICIILILIKKINTKKGKILTLNLLNVFWQNKCVSIFYVIPPHWNDKGGWNPSWWNLKDKPILHGQCHGYWRPGHVSSQDISSYGIDIISPEKSDPTR